MASATIINVFGRLSSAQISREATESSDCDDIANDTPSSNTSLSIVSAQIGPEAKSPSQSALSDYIPLGCLIISEAVSVKSRLPKSWQEVDLASEDSYLLLHHINSSKALQCLWQARIIRIVAGSPFRRRSDHSAPLRAGR